MDNYDGGSTYAEWSMVLPKKYMEDKEVRGCQLHTMRQQFTQLEVNRDDVADMKKESKQQLREKTWRAIKEIDMQYHDEAAPDAHDQDDHKGPKEVARAWAPDGEKYHIQHWTRMDGNIGGMELVMLCETEARGKGIHKCQFQ